MRMQQLPKDWINGNIYAVHTKKEISQICQTIDL